MGKLGFSSQSSFQRGLIQALRVILIGSAWLLLTACSLGAVDQSSLPGGLEPESVNVDQVVEGRLVPRRYVDIASFSAGRAAQVLVEEGDRVIAGQVLIRLDSQHSLVAEVAQAELELVRSRQALEDLYREAQVSLARAEVKVAEAIDDQALAEDRYQSYSRPTPQDRIDQTYANMVLAENRLENVRRNLKKAEKHFSNKNHIIWKFINQREFKLLLTQLRAELADSERRYWDARDKYQDLLEPPDEIELALRAGELAMANAHLEQARRERDELLGGPDPELVETALARLNAARARLTAARTAQKAAELVAPIDGQVVRVDIQPGEWIPAGQPVVIVADLSQWLVETEELGEELVPFVKPGREAALRLEAYPEQELSGQVESVDLLYREDEGDIYYNTQIDLKDTIPNMRWGMTVEIEFK